jgi:hypothetical protein
MPRGQLPARDGKRRVVTPRSRARGRGGLARGQLAKIAAAAGGLVQNHPQPGKCLAFQLPYTLAGQTHTLASGRE